MPHNGETASQAIQKYMATKISALGYGTVLSLLAESQRTLESILKLKFYSQDIQGKHSRDALTDAGREMPCLDILSERGNSTVFIIDSLPEIGVGDQIGIDLEVIPSPCSECVHGVPLYSRESKATPCVLYPVLLELARESRESS